MSPSRTRRFKGRNVFACDVSSSFSYRRTSVIIQYENVKK